MKKSIIATLTAFLTIVGLAYCSTDITSVEDEVPVVTPVTTNITTINTTSAVTTESVTTVTITNVTTTETITEVIIETEQDEPVETEATEVVVEPSVDPEPSIESIVTERYIVYKPSTHYLHMNSCRWNSGDAYRVDCTTELVARLCDECNPDVGDYIEYVEPEPEVISISDSNRYYLAIMVKHECSPRASVEHNATAVACMFNRVRDGWASSIYEAIQVGCVPWWGGGSLSDYGLYGDTGYCYDAVDYYLSHSDSYTWQHSWGASGDGIYNNYY